MNAPAREYVLAAGHQDPRHGPNHAKPRLVACKPPPAPKPGQRSPKPYGERDLRSLYAAAYSFRWLGFVTLSTPAKQRLDTWEKLKTTLKKLRSHLEYRHNKGGFPHLLAVTEFSSENVENEYRWHAHFHIAFADVLDNERQEKLRSWWQKQFPAEAWVGRCFDYQDVQDPSKVQSYLSKDSKKIKGNRQWTKFPCPILPNRVSISLWFCRGIPRPGSKIGRQLMVAHGTRRVRFQSQTGQSWLPVSDAYADTYDAGRQV